MKKNVRIDSLPSDRQIASKDCRLCTKRRIKCDRSIPQCRKCAIRGLSCPGFDPVHLRWDQGVASRGRLAGRKLPVPRRGESTDRAARNTSRNDTHSVSAGGHGSRFHVTGASETQPSVSLLCITDPTSDLGLVTRSSSAVLFDVLLGHFHLEVASRLRWIDSPDNPWRSFVIPLAEQSTCLRLSVLSLAASHLTATSGGESDRAPALLQVNQSLRDASLKALNQNIQSELNRGTRKNTVDSSCLLEMLATMLVLCYGEMLIPDSTDWNLHLHACRTVVDRYNLWNWREDSQDAMTKFLIKEVVDLESFGTFSAFAREQTLTTTISPQSILDGHFWSFTSLIREVTALERERYGLLQDGQQPADMDMSFWRTELEQAYTRASEGALSLPTVAERERFGSVIRAHYYASLIYGYQALAPSREANETISSVMTMLLHEIESNTAESTPTFCHDIFFPLFIVGTECRTDAHRQAIIETLFVQLISASGFWCNHAALRFLRAFWATSVDSKSWIQYARENERELGPFLVF